MSGTPSAPPDPHATTPVNLNKSHSGPPSKLANNHDWLEDAAIVPVMVGRTGSVIPGQPEDVSEEDDDEDYEEEDSEEKKDDDVIVTKKQRQMRGGHDRKSLLESHMKKPKISVRKLAQYLRWINLLKIWPKPLVLNSLHIDLCNGLLLCRLMKALVPSTAYVNLHKRPLSRKPAIANIEQALSVIWRGGRVNNSRIPSAIDIYQGRTDKITILISEIYEVYVMRPLRRTVVPDMLSWINIVLKQYGRSLSSSAMKPPYADLFPHFTSEVSIFCLIFHFMGRANITSRSGVVTPVDPSRIYVAPMNISEYRSNMSEIFRIMSALGIDILWKVDEFINYHDTDFLLLQLYKIFSHFVDMRCALPPAHGDTTGVSADANGEPVVVGMQFRKVGDDLKNNPITADVLIGDGVSQTVLAPVIVRDTTTLPPHFPPGLVCGKSYEQPSQSMEAPITASFASSRDAKKAALQNADKRRKSFAMLSAADTFVVEKSPKKGFFAGPESFVIQSEYDGAAIAGSSADIEQAIAMLQGQRMGAEKVMAEKEKQLETAYTQLELQEKMLPETMYDRQLELLDERMDALELERKVMEEGFEEKLAILKATPTAASVGAPPATSPRKTPTPSKKSKEAEDARKKQMETGWISQTKSNKTHNANLKMRQEESEASIARTMTRKNGESFSPFKEKKNEQSTLQFEEFAAQMRIRQEAWLDQKEAHADVQVKYLREQRKLRPNNMFRNAKPTGEVEEAMLQIRNEELKLMALEEERRAMHVVQEYKAKQKMLEKSAEERDRIAQGGSPLKHPRKESVFVAKQMEQQAALKEQMKSIKEDQSDQTSEVSKPDAIADSRNFLDRLQASYNKTHEVAAATNEAAAAPKVEEKPKLSSVQAVTDKFSAEELEAMNLESLPWLMAGRTLIMKERNSERQFEFQVVNGMDVCPHDEVRNGHSALKWGNGGGVSGFVSVVDMADVKQGGTDPSIMVITLKKPNAQAVRNTGGLPIVVIKCQSFPDCTKYRTGLVNLMATVE